MDSDEPQQPAVGETAGQQLKRAREAQGLSLKDIADAQHLRVSIIQAIEDGNYDQIDSELFLKGYVRTYAKQVGADADALIQSLDLELEPLRRERDKQEQENPLVDIERRRRKKRQVAKVFGTFVVLAAIALAVWKLVLEPRMAGEADVRQEQSESSDRLQSDETEAGSELEAGTEPEQGSGMPDSPDAESGSDVMTGLALDESNEEAGSPEETGSSDVAEDIQPASNAESLERAEAAATPVVAGVADIEQQSQSDGGSGTDSVQSESVESTAESSLGSSEILAEPAAQPAPVFEESAQPQSVAPLTQLEMSFVADCWVQVTDSSGARLVASLQRDGDRISVSGRPPLDVVIGAVDAVATVSFSGETVDLSSFRVVNNRTEFTLTL